MSGKRTTAKQYIELNVHYTEAILIGTVCEKSGKFVTRFAYSLTCSFQLVFGSSALETF